MSLTNESLAGFLTFWVVGTLIAFSLSRIFTFLKIKIRINETGGKMIARVPERFWRFYHFG